MTSATKIKTSCYTYKGWTIELVEGTWLMFPQGESGATDAANSKRDAMAMIDQWEQCDKYVTHYFHQGILQYGTLYFLGYKFEWRGYPPISIT